MRPARLPFLQSLIIKKLFSTGVTTDGWLELRTRQDFVKEAPVRKLVHGEYERMSEVIGHKIGFR